MVIWGGAIEVESRTFWSIRTRDERDSKAEEGGMFSLSERGDEERGVRG